MAGLMITADRCVRSQDLLAVSIWLLYRGANGDMLADWQAENGTRRGERKPVASGKVLDKNVKTDQDVYSHGYIV